jgi:hypothetical protein
MLPIKEMGIIISAWAILFVIFTGCGLFIRRSFGLKIHNFDNLLFSFWIGWAYAIFFLQIWNLFFKIDWWAFLLISILGAMGLLWNYQDTWYLLKKSIFKYWYIYLILILMTLWMANRSILSPFVYDSGLYHLTSVRWATSFPVVPGLGNLHGRLAFNSSYFLYLALLQIGFWVNKSYHFANGILILVLIMQILLSSIKFFKNNSEIKLYHSYYILFFIPVLIKIIKPDCTPDLVIFILGIVLSAEFLYFLENNDNTNNILDKEKEYTIFIITSLSILGITIKLSFFALGIAFFLFTIIIWLKKYIKSPGKAVDKKLFMWISGGVILGLLVWMIRGIILSGYIAYPSTLGAFPVEWRVPYTSVVDEANWIRSWARLPGVHWSKVLGNWDWFKPWVTYSFKAEKFNTILPLFISFVSIISIILKKFIKKKHYEIPKNMWLILLPPIIAIIFWFFTAPTIRFIGASFWILGVASIILAISCSNKLQWRKILIIIGISICTIYILYKYFTFEGLILTKDKIKNFYNVPKVTLKKEITNTGLVIFLPKEGDQCWDAQLPCSPYMNPDLRLRRKGDIRYGFIVYPKDE